MCFKTAKLPAPAAIPADTKAVTKHIATVAATYTVKATDTREVLLRLGKRESPTQFAQYFTPSGLREFASQLNTLADELEA